MFAVNIRLRSAVKNVAMAAEAASTQLFVGGLSVGTTELDLQKALGIECERVQLYAGGSYAFVTLPSAAAADALLQSPPPLLRIERARPQAEAPPRGKAAGAAAPCSMLVCVLGPAAQRADPGRVIARRHAVAVGPNASCSNDPG